MSTRLAAPAVLLLLALATLTGCATENYPEWLWNANHPDGGDGQDAPSVADAGAIGPRTCAQARAEPLPARLVAMSTNAASPPENNAILVSQLFDRFNDVCAPCHTAAADNGGQGGFQIATAGDFPSKMTAAVIAHLTGSTCPKAPNPSDPVDPMPPCSSPFGSAYASFTQRPAGDPIKLFATLVQEWIDAGSPPVSFTPPSAADAGAGDAAAPSALVMTPAKGNAMTDIGNCVPAPALMGVADDQARALDARFAAMQAKSSGTPIEMIGLPEKLSDTDLFTLDSEALARYGVIAYAPAYPLWTDDAGKLRYVRVPRGQSIVFDKATQQFTIPANTRFYKTFLKQIVDVDGSYRYRKIETRVIVSRPDVVNADGSAKPTALFGTYQWKDDESDAVLVQTPLNDGLPFADTLLFYRTDEPLAADLLVGQPSNPEVTLVLGHAARHYAIPSSVRCVQCHMGSVSRSFVLGFMPLQMSRRPVGEGGVIQETGSDELTQLRRFIDAGVVTGIDSLSDVLPLEASQGSRTPRNQYELVAQGYMLGNCAHCHNPRGLPTVQNPSLAGVLDFMPSAAGGIFQFPLERFSPRIGRGLTGSTPVPYITPSLVDQPRFDPKTGGQAKDPFESGSPTVFDVVYAPWRSIIYRNVDAAFAYTDDYALFPHMPMNSPGYDPRAKQILGDWMVSIPAARKHPELGEYVYQTDGTPADNIGLGSPDPTPQPYSEVLPGAPGYDEAVAQADARLAIFRTGTNPAVPLDPTDGVTYSRYADPGQTDDILDPAVLADPVCHPTPQEISTVTSPGHPYFFPDHPHWVNTDLSQPPGPWTPRQANWTTVLVEKQIAPPENSCNIGSVDTGVQAAYDDQVKAVGLLQSATLDEVSSFVTTAQPFGLWQKKPGCHFSSTVAPPVSSFTGSSRPHWMDVTNPAPDAPVYMQTPGATVFKMICINCHGPRADANGRLAQNLATMTGGNALVADFRDGLFGPPGASEDASNRHAIYGRDVLLTQVPQASDAWVGPSISDDDRAARYMAWMGLGGTSVNIPIAVLDLVAVTKVLDQARTLSASQLSANMLSQAKALCLSILSPSFQDALNGPTLTPGNGHGYLDAKITHLNDTLIPSNGDAELWLRLCSIANPAPVRVLTLGGSNQLVVPSLCNDVFQLDIEDMGFGKLLDPSVYPGGQPVGNAQGGVDSSLDPTNEWPWCVDARLASATQTAWIEGNGLPRCPSSALAAADACLSHQVGAVGCFTTDDANTWAVRGAINAGMAVYTYVQSIENTTPPPDYNACEQLP